MSVFDDFLNLLPPDVQAGVRVIWDSLGLDQKSSFLSLLDSFPTDNKMIRTLVKLSTKQLRQAFGRKQRVVIFGPANVGKSTLYNQWVFNKPDHADVGPLPGTTRENKLADSGLFSVVDTPGADAVGEVGEHEKYLAFSAVQEADFVVLVYDAIQGVKKTELELFHELSVLKKPFVVVLNKIDLVPRKNVNSVVEHAATTLGLKPSQVIPVVAKDGKNLSKVLLAVASTEPAMVAALGQALPQYRWQLAWGSIVSAASASAVIAIVPLPFIDFIPLVITQSVMVLGIARIYNYRISPQRAKELVVAFGLGFLGRTLFQELSKLGGLPGWLLAAAIASSTTVAMGYAAVRWFEKGEKLSTESLKKLTKDLTDKMLNSLKNIGKRKPDRASLQKQIEATLENSPMAQSPSELDEDIKE
jgi:small GTP-binding protein